MFKYCQYIVNVSLMLRSSIVGWPMNGDLSANSVIGQHILGQGIGRQKYRAGDCQSDTFHLR